MDHSPRPRRQGAAVPAAPTDTTTPRDHVFPEWRVNCRLKRRDLGYTDTAVYVSPFRIAAIDQWADDRDHVTVEVYTGTGRAVTTMPVAEVLNLADAVIARFRPAPARPSFWTRVLHALGGR
jgi:hypothetical protein